MVELVIDVPVSGGEGSHYRLIMPKTFKTLAIVSRIGESTVYAVLK